MARRCWSCTSSTPRRKLSTLPAPGRRMRWSRRSRNWTSFSSPWARAGDSHEVVEDACPDLHAKTATKPPVALTGKASPAKAAVGDEPVFAYIASLPQPQRGVAERIDALVGETTDLGLEPDRREDLLEFSEVRG